MFFRNFGTDLVSVLPPAKYLTMLCHPIWPSHDVLPTIKNIPMLFLSGLQDEIIPPSHMKGLYDLSQSQIKIWKDFPEGRHNDTVAEAGYFEAINDFIEQEILGEKDAKGSL